MTLVRFIDVLVATLCRLTDGDARGLRITVSMLLLTAILFAVLTTTVLLAWPELTS